MAADPSVPPLLAQRAPAIEPDHRVSLLLFTLAGIMAAGGCLVLFFFNPAEHAFYPFCLFYRTTGLMCPGCGGLRAMHQLLHGNVAAAVHLNALAVLVLPLGLVLAGRALLGLLGYQIPPLRVGRRWLWAALVVLFGFAIVRNIWRL